MQVGMPAPMEAPNAPPIGSAFSNYGFEGRFEQKYPFDTQQNWVHGYFQEIPAYGGHVFYRPYNYKDVLSQSQTAAGWGLSPTMPYSQQFWHRYHDQATMLKLSRNGAGPAPSTMTAGQVMTAPAMPMSAMPQMSTMPPVSPMSPAWQPQPMQPSPWGTPVVQPAPGIQPVYYGP
jgi:hypothetical protein